MPSVVGLSVRQASAVKRQLDEESDPPITPTRLPSKTRSGKSVQQDALTSLASRMSSKLEDGDFRGAVRLASLNDYMAKMSDSIFSAQLQIPLLIHNYLSHHSRGNLTNTVVVTESDISRVTRSFPNGSLCRRSRWPLTAAFKGHDGTYCL